MPAPTTIRTATEESEPWKLRRLLSKRSPTTAVVSRSMFGATNSYWHVSVEDADELPLDWASADIVSGMGNASVNLSVETNDGQTVRTGRIVFELDDMSSRTEIPFSQQK